MCIEEEDKNEKTQFRLEFRSFSSGSLSLATNEKETYFNALEGLSKHYNPVLGLSSSDVSVTL